MRSLITVGTVCAWGAWRTLRSGRASGSIRAVSSSGTLRAYGSFRSWRSHVRGRRLGRSVREDDPARSAADRSAHVQARGGLVGAEAHPTCGGVDHEVIAQGVEQPLSRNARSGDHVARVRLIREGVRSGAASRSGVLTPRSLIITSGEGGQRDRERLEATQLVQVEAHTARVVDGEVHHAVSVHLNPLVAKDRRTRVYPASQCDITEDTAVVPQDARRASLSSEEEIDLLITIYVTPLSLVDTCDPS